MGPCIANCRVSAFLLKLIPRKMPNPDMATTSSAAQAEMTRVGMPLATPKPLSERLMRQGMMTAGETAARTNPSMKPTVQGKPRMKWERQATAAASTKQGMKVARMTIPDRECEDLARGLDPARAQCSEGGSRLGLHL